MSGKFDLVGIGMTSQRTRNRLVERLREKGVTSESVLAAIGAVPRHIFIDEALAHRAYEDTALPIGQGQTISQPFVVALMTQTLLDRPRPRILEVGTGSGYQTAILGSMEDDVQKVFTHRAPVGTHRREHASVCSPWDFVASAFVMATAIRAGSRKAPSTVSW